MNFNVQQFLQAPRVNLDSFVQVAHKTFSSIEGLVALNVSTSKAFQADMLTNLKALSGVKSVREYMAVQASLTKPMASKAAAYGHELFNILTKPVKDIPAAAQAKTVQAHEPVVIAVKKAASETPASRDELNVNVLEKASIQKAPAALVKAAATPTKAPASPAKSKPAKVNVPVVAKAQRSPVNVKVVKAAPLTVVPVQVSVKRAPAKAKPVKAVPARTIAKKEPAKAFVAPKVVNSKPLKTVMAKAAPVPVLEKMPEVKAAPVQAVLAPVFEQADSSKAVPFLAPVDPVVVNAEPTAKADSVKASDVVETADSNIGNAKVAANKLIKSTSPKSAK